MALPAAAEATPVGAASAAIVCKYFLRFIVTSPVQADRAILSQLAAAVSARRSSPGAASARTGCPQDRSTAPPALRRPLRSDKPRAASAPARRPLPPVGVAR